MAKSPRSGKPGARTASPKPNAPSGAAGGAPKPPARSGKATKPRAASQPKAARPVPDIAPAPPQAGAPPSATKAQTPAKPSPPLAPLGEMLLSQTPAQLDQLSRTMAEVMTKANGVFSMAFQDQSRSGLTPRADPFDAQGALNAFWMQAASQPDLLRAAHGNLWQRYTEIWQAHAMRLIAGGEESVPVRDRRFQDPEWHSNPAFSLMRETYLATADWITSLIDSVEGLDEATKRKAGFFIKQAVDAASPSNFALTNPAVLRATLQSQGANLKSGLENLAEDLRRGDGALSIRQTDLNAFKVGENIATAPGKVVFRNELIELIQYTPQTPTVLDVPLLIFPPWINKFYILDLQPKNSMIRYLVAKGHTVFVASWVNPDEKLAEKTFEDYIRQGVYAGIEAACSAAEVKRVHTVGYCIGGTLLATSMALMAKRKDERIASATFFAAQTDFELAGELKVFTDNPAIDYIEERIAAKGGLLDAQAMADTFNALRSNDLIWNFIVENYYLGRKPGPFDLLFWNADQTRMPHALHMFYLRRFYRDNALAKGELLIEGERLSLKDVKTPVFMQSSKEDHIAPFPSVYRSAKAFGGPTQFLMAGSGHIAGVINHPDANKYQHWINTDLPAGVEDWRAGAQEFPGSWWPHWQSWLAKQSGGQVPARMPGTGTLPALCDAPGEYVRRRSSP